MTNDAIVGYFRMNSGACKGLADSCGTVAGAARALGVPRGTFRSWISPDEARKRFKRWYHSRKDRGLCCHCASDAPLATKTRCQKCAFKKARESTLQDAAAQVETALQGAKELY